MPKKNPSSKKTAPKSASKKAAKTAKKAAPKKIAVKTSKKPAARKAAAKVTRKAAVKNTAAKTARTTSSKIPAVKAAKAAAPIGKAAKVAKTTAPAEALVASVHSSAEGLKVTAYRGDGSVLLAFNFDAQPEPGFAGFAVQCTAPDGSKFFLKNRLTFDTPVTNKTTPAQRHAMPNDTNVAPYQKFRWADFSSSKEPGTYRYTVSAMYHDKNGGLAPRATTNVSLNLGMFQSGNLEVGFTRGFLSSQAYVDQFHNAPIRPAQKSIDYDTKGFEKQYEWLGYHARRMLFDFLNQCLNDKDSALDLLAYDLDEPDVIRALTNFGSRLRAFLDDAPLHTKPGAMEIDAKKALLVSAGAANVKTGHFKRFAHCKVFIQKKNGVPVRVLTGSANFSVRGLYVQANNVLVFDDPETAANYEAAFQQAFDDMKGFAASKIAAGWIDMSGRPSLPSFQVAFSPHKSADISLGKVADAVKNAKSSVLFAIMELGGGGPVLSQVKDLATNDPNIFSYGVTQSLSGMSVFKPGATDGILTPFAFLSKQVPPPFDAEISGGAGQVIHDKFVVIDFDTDTPIVFTGSSNLAGGGEIDNGDNLLAITHPDVASIFAVQAVGLVDHFHFRAIAQRATSAQPLTLDASDKWWQQYYEKGSIKERDRTLFCP